MTCAHCGKEFETANWRRKSCSPECAWQIKRAKNRASQNALRETRTGRKVTPRNFKPKPTPGVVTKIVRGYFAILRFENE